MSKPWFQHKDGIRIHYGEQREAEQQRHRQAMDRINKEENQMQDALASSLNEVIECPESKDSHMGCPTCGGKWYVLLKKGTKA